MTVCHAPDTTADGLPSAGEALMRPTPSMTTEPFAETYARRWHQLRGAEWLAYTEGRPLARTGLDRELFEAASNAHVDPGDASSRSPIERLRRRVLVDHHPEVARLRARLDDGSAYAPAGTSPRDPRGLAAAMEPDILALVELRRDLSSELGSPSYFHLAVAAEGLDADELVASLAQLREHALAQTATVRADADLTIETWFAGLDSIAGPTDRDPVPMARELALQLGCEDLLGSVTWVVRDGPIAGWAAAVSIPEDVRIVVRPAGSVRDIMTVCHELGHVLAYAGTQTRGIGAIPTDTQDEAMGMLMERIGLDLVVPAPQRQRLVSIAAAEVARTATSALFEIALEQDPTRARDLFAEWYAPLVSVPDPVVWALDSFRSLDPCRVHAYPIGASFADATLASLRRWYGEDPRAWGGWLRERLWAPGRRSTFAELAQLAA